MRGGKTGNEYQAALGRLYADTPKAVWAALAFSFADRLDDPDGGRVAALLDEWRLLHENGIIPQAPPKVAL